MFYIKDEDGNKKPLDKVSIFCQCPNCCKEVHVKAFWELVTDDNLDITDSAVWCDHCTEWLKGVYNGTKED